MRATPQLAICMPLGHQAEWLREWDYAMFARCREHLPTSQQQHRQHSVRSPMAVSDQDLIECWFGRLTVPEIVKKLDLKSNSELRLQWRRLNMEKAQATFASPSY